MSDDARMCSSRVKEFSSKDVNTYCDINDDGKKGEGKVSDHVREQQEQHELSRRREKENDKASRKRSKKRKKRSNHYSSKRQRRRYSSSSYEGSVDQDRKRCSKRELENDDTAFMQDDSRYYSSRRRHRSRRRSASTSLSNDRLPNHRSRRSPSNNARKQHSHSRRRRRRRNSSRHYNDERRYSSRYYDEESAFHSRRHDVERRKTRKRTSFSDSSISSPRQHERDRPVVSGSSSSSSANKKTRKHSESEADSSVGSSNRDDSIGHFREGPGTIIARRYRLLKDVGIGTFGRVVDCLDLHKCNSASDGVRNDFDHTVAIKIVRNIKRYHESAIIEADILRDINSRSDRRGTELCCRLLDRFDFKGHYCLVFESLGLSLYDFWKTHGHKPFPFYCVRDFSRQILNALDFLHGFHLIHTDLKPENILLVSKEEVPYSYNGHTVMVPKSTAIKLIDMGGATYDYEKKSSLVNTRQYRAPEVILGLGWSTPSDLWSAGCIIAELHIGELLFATHDNTEHLALMESCIGPIPMQMLKHAHLPGIRSIFDLYSGWHRRSQILSAQSMSHVRRMQSLGRLIRDRSLLKLLRGLLIIDPCHRFTAREARHNELFHDSRPSLK